MFTPQAFTPFLIGSVALAVLGNAVYQLLTDYVGTESAAVGKIGVGALLVLLSAAWVISRIVNRLRPASPLLDKRSPKEHKGLILLVSNEPTTRKAIEWHYKTLECCWLFCSTQSSPIADKLRSELDGHGKKVKTEIINDVFDPLEYKEKIEAIYEKLPQSWTDSDVILDFTGMTACASVGSVLACLNEQRAIQYTPGQYDTTLKAMQPLNPVEVVLHWGQLRIPSISSSQL